MVDVVLDENAYIMALNAECTKVEADERAARVVALIQQHHRWIFTADVLQSYRRQFSRCRCKSALTSWLMVSLTEVSFDASRFLVVDHRP